MSGMLGEPGITILMTLQLALSLLAMVAWLIAARDSSKASAKRAALATSAWFAGWATMIAYLFDVSLLP